MRIGNAGVVAFYVHLYNAFLTKVFGGMLLDAALQHCAEKEMRELNGPKKPVENLFLDPL